MAPIILPTANIILPPTNMDFDVRLRGAAKDRDLRAARKEGREPDPLGGQNLCMGFGFSEKVYPIKKVAAIVAWAIRHALRDDGRGGINGKVLVFIPDATERFNMRGRWPEKYRFVPLHEPLAHSPDERALTKLALKQKEDLVDELTKMGYPPITYEIKLASEICRNAVGLEDIEQLLFTLKNKYSTTYQLYYENENLNLVDRLRLESRFPSIDPEGHALDFMKMQQSINSTQNISKAADFKKDVEKIPIDIFDTVLNKRVDNLQGRIKNQFDYLNWIVEYVIKQTAFSLYMAFRHEPNYPVKFGPATERRFDKLVYGLLGDAYGPLNPIKNLFVGHLFGSVYIEPEMPKESLIDSTGSA